MIRDLTERLIRRAARGACHREEIEIMCSTYAIVGIYLIVSIPIFIVVYNASDNVIDEEFHLRQGKHYCNGSFEIVSVRVFDTQRFGPLHSFILCPLHQFRSGIRKSQLSRDCISLRRSFCCRSSNVRHWRCDLHHSSHRLQMFGWFTKYVKSFCTRYATSIRLIHVNRIVIVNRAHCLFVSASSECCQNCGGIIQFGNFAADVSIRSSLLHRCAIDNRRTRTDAVQFEATPYHRRCFRWLNHKSSSNATSNKKN